MQEGARAPIRTRFPMENVVTNTVGDFALWSTNELLPALSVAFSWLALRLGKLLLQSIPFVFGQTRHLRVVEGTILVTEETPAHGDILLTIGHVTFVV